LDGGIPEENKIKRTDSKLKISKGGKPKMIYITGEKTLLTLYSSKKKLLTLY